MPTISTHDESNRELCLTCPMADCDDKSPQCPINQKAEARKQERKEYFKEYYRANLDKRRAYNEANRERRSAQLKEYYRANLEQRKAYFKARYQAKKLEAMK